MEDPNIDEQEIIQGRVRSLISKELSSKNLLDTNEFYLTKLEDEFKKEFLKTRILYNEVYNLKQEVIKELKEIKNIFKEILKKEQLARFERNLEKFYFESYMYRDEFERNLKK